MAKKNTKASTEDKKDYTSLSQTLKLESPKDKLSGLSTKDSFDSLFAEYNKYFILISNEISDLDILLDESRNYLAMIHQAYKEKFIEDNSDDNFSEPDDDSDGSESDASSIPPPKKNLNLNQKAVKNQNQSRKNQLIRKK